MLYNHRRLKMLHLQNLRNIFLKAVESVRPLNLLSAANNYCLRPQSETGGSVFVQIQGKKFDISNKQCHVVGFGKAVLGMAVQLERALEGRIIDGIISIPVGTLNKFKNVNEMRLSNSTNIEVIEGSPNNHPDEAALEAAKKIKELASQMTDKDILFVLISGGGSALLPLPRSPITLKEKMELVRQLANNGASIDEMNLVRIALSEIKGGRLAVAACNANSIISFVISDIVGDPVDLIASGPTCAPALKRTGAQNVLLKYNLWNNQPEHIKSLLKMPIPLDEITPGKNNSIYVVGDNRVATTTAVQEALQCGYNPFIVSTTIQGDVEHLAKIYSKFLQDIRYFQNKIISEDELKQRFPYDSRIFQHFIKTLAMCEKASKPLLLILAGEPTVHVTGTGLGGRNQELALRMSIEFFGNPQLKNISFLSAGTDGIDGPTPAAGALGSCSVIEEFLQCDNKTLANVEDCLINNDSYNFYNQLDAGKYHLVTGHTGTNVMDLHLILME